MRNHHSQSQTHRFAVLLLHLSTFHTFSAAITAIVVTAFVIIIVVANAVTLELSSPASFWFGCFVRFIHFHASCAAHVVQGGMIAEQAFKALFAGESILFVNQFVNVRAIAVDTVKEEQNM